MRLRFIWTGKTRDARLRSLIEEYFDRLGHFVRCEITELKESPASETQTGIEKDSRRISDALHTGGVTVLLDPNGKEWTSRQLADEVQRWNGNGVREVSFIVGGPRGVTRELSGSMDLHWSLSRLTFTHELARVLVVEQVYRAYTIVHGLPYQK